MVAEDLSRIRNFVDSLVQRERALLLAKVFAQLCMVFGLLVGLMLLGAAFRWDRPAMLLAVILVAGIGSWWVGARQILLHWGASGDAMRQARLVEGLRPELEGRLLTSVERVEAPHGQESGAIVAWIASKAARTIDEVEPFRVHPATRAMRLVMGGAVLWLGLPVLSLLLPGGPGAAWRWWTGGAAAVAAMADGEGLGPEAVARVGDLVLRYRYPSYTGLEDKVVPNSTGDVQAPPGTIVEVTARSANPVEAAGLEAYGRRLDASVAADGREVHGRFNVGKESGSYHLRLYRGGEPENSRAYAIEAMADLPPDVTLDVGEESPVELAVDDVLSLAWRARDDFGVKRVQLQVDGADVGVPLYEMVDRRAEVFETERSTPGELGLRPGDHVTLRVAAWDNDTIAGSKVGFSPGVEVVVLGARGLDRRAAQRQSQLLSLMIPVLAKHLIDPWPPGASPESTSGEMAAWGEDVASRYIDLFSAVESEWKGMLRDELDATLMDEVTRSGTELIRYTQVAFEPRSRAVPKAASIEVTAGLRDAAIVALEDAVLAFHRMQRNRAMQEVVEMSKNLEAMSRSIEDMLGQEDPDLQELMARLDQLQRMLAEMMQAAAKLEDGGLREFVNQREGELQDLMSQVQEALAKGDKDEAEALMERLAEQIQQLGEGIQEDQERRQGEGDDAMERAQELSSQLEQLEQKQRDLKTKTKELQEKEGGEEAKKAAEMWAELEVLTEKHVGATTAYQTGLDDAQRPFWERSRVEGAAESSERLHNGVRARDLRGAFGSLERAELGWQAARVAGERSVADGHTKGPGLAAMGALRQQLAKIRSLLEQLQQQTAKSSPETQQQAQQLQDEQKELQNELQQASESAAQLQQDMPVQPKGMEEALEDATERMESASEDLGEGQPMQAEGEQGVASQRLKDARESLDQAVRQAQQQAQGSGQGSGKEGEGEGKDEGEGEEGTKGKDHRAELDIPSREEFRTPEEYRKALLEGMEGEVPEEFRAMKKRYYEELVHQ